MSETKIISVKVRIAGKEMDLTVNELFELKRELDRIIGNKYAFATPLSPLDLTVTCTPHNNLVTSTQAKHLS